MPIDVSKLNDPVVNLGLFGSAVLKDTVLKNFAPHQGLQVGTARINVYNGGGDFGECCAAADGTGAFDTLDMNVSCIKVGNSICETDLGAKFEDARMRYGAGSEQMDREIETVITEQELAAVSRNIDRAVWKGDTASADGNLNKFDGIIKQFGAAVTAGSIPAAQNITVSTGHVLDALRTLIQSIPVEEADRDYNIYMGTEIAQAIRPAVVAQNLTHFNPGTTRPTDPFTVPGFSGITVIPTRGLNGTRKIFAAVSSNGTQAGSFHFGTNVEADMLKLEWAHDWDTDAWKFKLKFLLGVGIFEPQNTVMATLDAAVTSDFRGMPVTVTSPVTTVTA